MEQTLTCSDIARAFDEPLAGTVKPTNVFFLIETNATEYGGWRHEIVKIAKKSGEFEHYIKHLHRIPNSKILFIRKPQSNSKNFYIAITHQDKPKVYHTELADYADLLKLDLNTVAPDYVPLIDDYAMSEVDELYAVCTNGKHDPCCSTYGIPVYNALLQHADPDQVWQVSHIGGHRLAATMYVFPHGICYGYLDPTNAEEVVTNYKAGYQVNYKYRGRGSYGAHNFDVPTHQAVGSAEYHIRESAKKYAINDLILDSAESVGDMQWRVSFRDQSGTVYRVRVETTMSEPRSSSCGEEPKPVPIHTVSAYEMVAE